MGIQRLKVGLGLIACIGVGLLLGRLGGNAWPSIQQVLFPSPLVYVTPDTAFKERVENAELEALTWEKLLPSREKDIIQRYQNSIPQSVQDMTSQILRSIEASSDESYQQALTSTNTEDWFVGKIVSISGFIVPIDFHPDKSVKNFFLVPYFGACLHFPPPPPNQMIFARIDNGFNDIDIMQAYTLRGRIDLGLFEDPIGTSAYTVDVATIAPFMGQPDDVRVH